MEAAILSGSFIHHAKYEECWVSWQAPITLKPEGSEAG